MTEPEEERCPACDSTRVVVLGTRDRHHPDGRVVARTLDLCCRRCLEQWSVLRRVTAAS